MIDNSKYICKSYFTHVLLQINNMMKINILILLIFILTTTHTKTTQDGEEPTDNQYMENDQIQRQIIQQQEKQIVQTEEDNLSPWIADELKVYHKDDQSMQFGEYFILQLESGQQEQFRCPLKISGKEYKLSFQIFTQESGDDFTYIRDPQEDSFVEIQFKHRLNAHYQNLNKVYMMKSLSLQYDDGLFIKLKNLNNVQVFVQVALQGDPIVINKDIIAKNDHFSLPAQKISAIHEQLKKSQGSRYRHYKTQWGFHEREEHYESEMLTLTGVELLIILITSIVQMFCIKGLLDNKQVI